MKKKRRDFSSIASWIVVIVLFLILEILAIYIFLWGLGDLFDWQIPQGLIKMALASIIELLIIKFWRITKNDNRKSKGIQ